MWPIKLFKAILKQRWIWAIESCLNQRYYGSKTECKLCLEILTFDKEMKKIVPDCNACICLSYVKLRPWWNSEKYNNKHTFLGEEEYCGDIVEETRGEGERSFNNINTRNHLRLMADWLETNY